MVEPEVRPFTADVVRELQRQVSDQMVAEEKDHDGAALSEEDREQRGRALIRNAVARWATEESQRKRALSEQAERDLIDSVFNSIFRAGRLEPLLRDPDIENIYIRGTEATVDYYDRPHQPVGRIAGSEQEVIDLIRGLARRAGQERVWTPARPTLDLRLPDGSRLAAAAWVTEQVEVTIRRHRILHHGLEQLVAWGTIDETLAAFLAALVLARKNVVIAGSQAVGKTTLLRAMARQIPMEQRVVTLETERELWLHKDEGRTNVISFEAREGNGEFLPDGRQAGEVPLDQLFRHALRHTNQRTMVGEVRGPEAPQMVEAMTSGEGGSMATMHINTGRNALPRLARLCAQFSNTTIDNAFRALAESIDFVVILRMVDETPLGGRRHRFVSEVLEVTGLGDSGQPATQFVFKAGERDPRAVPYVPPNCLADLERVGFDRRLLAQPGVGRWRAMDFRGPM
ncbi:hypothetical protein BIV57_13390 [Mangrovactinospora gilvigrisea]|uniref:Bacterial type II secretion system protein E domain-containing protein n=1 Tax=Mangrovactinospora gilvigrisea TaxID=1428644 RepID=A0A1J7BEA5_9ACTN|nr:hypothetical protein BIV57_13390 [Mangrovactinospora gilvigrisea]